MKKNIFIKIIFLLIAVNALHAQLVHPGISHKLSDLDRMKYMVDAEMEPWISSFNSLQADAKSSYNYSVNGDTSITTVDGANGGFLSDCYAAYYNALMWYITEDTRHAEKSIEIFNSWVNLTSVTGIPLSQGRGPWKLLEGAEIIKHTYTGWSTADQQAFSDMLVYPGYSTTSVPSGNTSFYWGIYQGDSGRHGNQGLFAMRSMMAMGIFLDNEIMYDRALRYIQGLPHRIDDLPYPSGPSINGTTNISGCDYFEEYTRSGDGTAIPDYGYNEVMSNYIYENGQSQESSRDQAHALAGVSILSCMTEIAWNQGDDLYGHLDNRLLLGFEFYYKYNLSFIKSFPDQLTPWEPTVASGEYIERTDRSGRWKALRVNPYLVCDESPEELHRGRTNLLVAPVFEQSLGHYKDRLHLDAENYKWLERGFENLIEEIGLEDGRNPVDHAGWGGLKFRRVSPGDPISGFDGNGLPIYVMNELPMTIEAEHYDYFVLDGQDRTYNDTSVSNEGSVYRTDEGVDLKVSSEGGYSVTNIDDGEWLTYTVNVPASGTYDIDIRYASANANGNIKFNFADTDVTSDVTVPFGGSNSTGLTDWQDLKVGNEVHLTKGVQAMKILFSGSNDSFELNSITVSLIAADPDSINLAYEYGTATQSIDTDPCPYLTGCADRAIDGNTDGNFGNGSVSHTDNNINPKWWQVDLGDNYMIDTIDIYNRTGYENRLNDITIEVIDSEGNVTFSYFYSGYPDPTASISTGGVVGQIVRISKTTIHGITLAEVEVYGIDQVVTLSNEDFELKNTVKLYPNPATNMLNITNAQGLKVSVYSVLGKEVLTTQVEQTNQSIDISGLKSGVYFVKIGNTTASITKKIVKR